MDKEALLKRRRKISQRMPKAQECLRGSLVIMNRVCGKSNCRCLKGQRHKAIYLSQSRNGKTRMFYLPQNAEEKACGYIKNYREIKKALNSLSDINIKLLTKGQANG